MNRNIEQSNDKSLCRKTQYVPSSLRWKIATEPWTDVFHNHYMKLATFSLHLTCATVPWLLKFSIKAE